MTGLARAFGVQLRVLVLALTWLCWPGDAHAHDVRPAFLQLTQTGHARYQVLWKRPLRGDKAPPLTPVFPDDCHELSSSEALSVQGALVQRSLVECEATLSGRSLRLDGLGRTLIDTLVQVNLTDGTSQSLLLRTHHDTFVVAAAPSSLDVAGSYVTLGVEHILLGFDHLLFVLGLLWIVHGLRRLVAAITAFTAAHSLTLALASLGFLRVPGPPVEAAIALSIVCLAAEILHGLSGRPGWTARRPWAIAFSVGLLHGLGFAGALADVGLPEAHVPLALFSFNLGVELGQVGCVLAVSCLLRITRAWREQLPRWLERGAVYALGSIAAFWAAERSMSFL
ncbi:MAG TPA: HupE/UreJ family protein [Polyangiaceae bacterium]